MRYSTLYYYQTAVGCVGSSTTDWTGGFCLMQPRCYIALKYLPAFAYTPAS